MRSKQSNCAVAFMAFAVAAHAAEYPHDAEYAALEVRMRADIEECQRNAKTVQAKFFCANSQFASLSRKVSTNFWRRLR